MATGLQGAPRKAQKVLLWLVGLVMIAVVVATVGMEYSASRDGGGEMVHSLALLFSLALLAYFGCILLFGRLILKRAAPEWGWHLVAVMLILVFGPVGLLVRAL